MKRGFLFFLLALLAFPVMTFAQEPEMKRSTVIEQYKGNPCYLHFVKQGETLSKLSKLYNISIEEIKAENPVLEEGLKVDQVLRIPKRPETEIAPESREKEAPAKDVAPGKGKVYIVKKKETLYGISKQFNVSLEDLLKANPQLTVLQEGMELIIPEQQPEKSETPAGATGKPVNGTNTASYEEIQVQQGQTVYSLSKQYGLTVEEFLAMNPEVSEGLKADQIVKVPARSGKVAQPNTGAKTEKIVHQPEEPAIEKKPAAVGNGTGKSEEADSCFSAKNISRTYNIAILLPLELEEADSILALEEGSTRTVSSFKTFDFIQFYGGLMLAADSLEKSGFRAKIHIYDADKEDDTLKVKKTLRKSEMQKMDLIIGPVFLKSFEVASRFALKQHINIVNPLSKREKFVTGNPYVYKIQPPDDAIAARMASFVAAHYPGSTLILVRNGLKEQAALYSAFMKSLKQEPGYSGIQVKEVNYSTDKFAGVTRNVSDDRKNIVILFSSSRSVVPNFVSLLNNYGKSKELMLMGLPGWEEMDIETDFLVNLDYHQVSTNFINYESEETKQFIRQFRQQYGAEPQVDKQAFLGFDIGWYFFHALMNYGSDFGPCLRSMQPDGLQTDIRFSQKSTLQGGYQNTSCKIVTIKDFRWEEVK